MTLRFKSFLLSVGYVCFSAGVCAAAFLVPDSAWPEFIPPHWRPVALTVCLAAFGLIALLVHSAMSVGRIARVARLIERYRGSPDLADKLAGSAHDEVGRLAHEMSVCLRQSERDRDEAQRVNRSVLLAQRRVAAVLDVLPLAVMILDEQGRVVQFSRPAGRLLGWKPSEAARKPVGHFFPEPFGEDDSVFQNVRNRLADPARNGAAVSFRVTGRSAAGVEASFQMHVQELAGSNRQEYVSLVRARDGDDVLVGTTKAPAERAAPNPPKPSPSPVPNLVAGNVQNERVDVCGVVEACVAELEVRDRVRLMNPAHAYADAQQSSLEVVIRDVLEAALHATFPTATVNVTVTETAESVGVIVEAPTTTETLETLPPPRLTFAAEVVRALGGALDIYDDIPGVVQIVVELRAAETAESR